MSPMRRGAEAECQILLCVTLKIYKKKTIFDIIFTLNLTYYLLNIFLYKMPIWATDGYYRNTVFIAINEVIYLHVIDTYLFKGD